MSCFSKFFTETKNKPLHSIFHAQFSRCAKFHENPFQTHEKLAKLANFYKEMYARGSKLKLIYGGGFLSI